MSIDLHKKPRIIAVAGGSGSGKTTLVNRLRDACGTLASDVLVLQLDHYYADLSPLPKAERDRRNFDHPDAFDTVLLLHQLQELAAGREVVRPTYDFATHTRTGAGVRVAPAPVIVLDGILAMHWPEVRRVLDLAVFVEVDDDVRFIRRLSRDISERGRTAQGVIDQYLETVKVMHDLYVAPQALVADLIVSWLNYNDRAVAMLSGTVRAWIAESRR